MREKYLRQAICAGVGLEPLYVLAVLYLEYCYFGEISPLENMFLYLIWSDFSVFFYCLFVLFLVFVFVFRNR